MNKSEARELRKGDFIPDGPRICNTGKLRYRKTREDEVFRCCRQIDDDPQSGPIFCGEIAEYLAPVEDLGIHCLCEKHRPPKNQIDD